MCTKGSRVRPTSRTDSDNDPSLVCPTAAAAAAAAAAAGIVAAAADVVAAAAKTF